MAAWFALTQFRYRDVLDAAHTGQQAAPSGSAAAQLAGQEAKAHARMGDIDGVREALGRGRTMLDAMPRASRPDHHFVVDPDKWDFYAMDCASSIRCTEPSAHLVRATSADSHRRPS